MARSTVRLDKLEALYRINESVLSILDLNQLLDKVINIVEGTFGLDACAILLLDDETEELYIKAAKGYGAAPISAFRTTAGGRGLTGHVASTLKPLYVPDVTSDQRYVSGVEGARSEIAIPLLVEDRLVGILDIESRQEHDFAESDIDVLTVFGSQIALAINNALVFESEKKRASQLLVFNRIRKRASLDLELDKLLEVVANSVIEFLGYSKILIFINLDQDQAAVGGGLRLMAWAGVEKLESDDVIYERLRGGVVEAAFSRNETLAIMDVESGPFKAPLLANMRAELAIPLTIRRSAVGVLYVASRHSGAFDDKDVQIMETISDQLTTIMRDTTVFSDISKRGKHLEIIRRISQVAIQSFELDKFLSDTVHLIQQIFGFYSVVVFSFDPQTRQLELAAHAGVEPGALAVGDRIAAEHGIVGHVAFTKEYFLCNDVSQENRYNDILVNTKSELAVPVIRHPEANNGDNGEEPLLGVINIESSRLNQFDSSDVEIFTRIADQIAYTITNAELYREKTSAHDLLLDLNDLSRRINSSFDLQNTISMVVRELPRMASCRLCSIFFYQEASKELVLMGHNFPAAAESDEPVSLQAESNVLMGKVIALKRSVHVQDIESELNIPNRPQYETKSFLNILLRHEERIIGVLNLTDKLERNFFSAGEFYLINSFCEHLATAIANAERYQQILELSVTDGLTSLYVHRYFQNTLAAETARATRHGVPLSLVMLDVDDFKKFNDSFGHQVGDLVLREIALAIRKTVREYDIPTRYGGEEFGIILPSTSRLQARAFAERLGAAISESVAVPAHPEVRISVSQGVSQYQPGSTKDEFIRQADQALLAAKRAGKNQVMVYNPSAPGAISR